MLGAASFALMLATSPPAIVSRYTRLSSCRQWAAGDVSNNAQADWIVHRCSGLQGHPVWIGFVEGTRMQVGFGKRPNLSGYFETDRNEKWPIEWRGRLVNGRFVPSAAIIRVQARFDDSGVSTLVVYRLLEDGTSCLYDRTVDTNAEARMIADALPVRKDCSIGQTLFLPAPIPPPKVSIFPQSSARAATHRRCPSNHRGR